VLSVVQRTARRSEENGGGVHTLIVYLLHCAAGRAGQVEEVYGAYKHLAKYFAQLARLRTAEFFFKQ
jgi:hypothetical protein